MFETIFFSLNVRKNKYSYFCRIKGHEEKTKCLENSHSKLETSRKIKRKMRIPNGSRL